MIAKGSNKIFNDIRSIFLIQLGDIGDVVLTLPCIRALRDYYPEANIVVAVRKKAKELIQDCQWASDVIVIDEEKRGFWEEIVFQYNFFLNLRRHHFDLIIDMRTGTRGAVLAYLSGAPQRIGYFADDGKLWRNRLFTSLYKPEHKPDQYVAEYHNEMLESFGVPVSNVFPEITIPNEKQKKIKELLSDENISPDEAIIAIQPFSLWQYKEWGIEKYIQLVKWIVSVYGMTVIVTGSSEEGERAKLITEECGRGVHNFAGKTSLGEYPALLHACCLFIGVDSAGLHLAAAAGIPTISIFGPSSPGSWAPKGERHRVVQNGMDCVPCRQKGCNDSEISKCLDELSVEQVKKEVKFQLDFILYMQGRDN